MQNKSFKCGDIVSIKDSADHIPENVKNNLYVINSLETEKLKDMTLEQGASLREIDGLPILIDDVPYTSIFLDSKYIYKKE